MSLCLFPVLLDAYKNDFKNVKAIALIDIFSEFVKNDETITERKPKSFNDASTIFKKFIETGKMTAEHDFFYSKKSVYETDPVSIYDTKKNIESKRRELTKSKYSPQQNKMGSKNAAAIIATLKTKNFETGESNAPVGTYNPEELMRSMNETIIQTVTASVNAAFDSKFQVYDKKVIEVANKVEKTDKRVEELEQKLDNFEPAWIKDDLKILEENVSAVDMRLTSTYSENQELKEKIGDLEAKFRLFQTNYAQNGNDENYSPDEETINKWLTAFNKARSDYVNAILGRMGAGMLRVDFKNTERFITVENRDSPEIFDINFDELQTVLNANFTIVNKIKRINGYSAIIKINSSSNHARKIATLNLIENRSDFRGQLGLKLAVPERFNIDARLRYICENFTDELGHKIVLDFDITKRGFYFLTLNDWSEEKETEFLRANPDRARNFDKKDVCTRIFINAPTIFTTLGRSQVTVQNLIKLKARDEAFYFNGRIHMIPENLRRRTN